MEGMVNVEDEVELIALWFGIALHIKELELYQ